MGSLRLTMGAVCEKGQDQISETPAVAQKGAMVAKNDDLNRVQSNAYKMSDDDVKAWQLAAAKTVFRAMHKDEEAKTLLVLPGEKWADLWEKMDSDTRNHHIDEQEFVAFYLQKCAE